jgi:transposase
MLPLWFGEIEVDESYFGGHRKGKRGRGAAGKILCSAC